MLKITFSADESLIRKARAYAHAHQTTLNQLVRDYLGRLVDEQTPADVAEAFRHLAFTQLGKSPAGWRFERNRIHRHDDDGR